MFCLKLKELRNLNSVRLALQALPTSPSPRDFERKKNLVRGWTGDKKTKKKQDV